jgi:hypothetical protein
MQFKVTTRTLGKIAFVLTLAAVLLLTLSATVQAGNQRLCARTWQTLQSGSGESFSSLADCASSSDVWAPIVTIARPAANQIVISGRGFHASTTIVFALFTNVPIQTFTGATDADGGFVLQLPFSGCTDPTEQFGLRAVVTDSFGVHASAQIPLCP